MVHKVWGQSDHPSGLGGISVQILAMSFHILGHHSPTRASSHPKTRWQHLLCDTKSSWVLKSRFGEGWLSTFWAPLVLIFFNGNGPWSIWSTTGSFCPIWYSFLKFRRFIKKNDTNQVSGWWDVREKWWKIGFTPQANRHFCPSWQHSISSAISSYLWVLSLIVASWGAHTQFAFQKYPFFRPFSTPFGIVAKNSQYKEQGDLNLWARFK